MRGAADDDQVIGRHHKGKLTTRASSKKSAGRHVRETGPPQVAVTRTDAGLRKGTRAVFDPLPRDDLTVVPPAVVQVKQRKPSEVARAHVECVCRID